MEHPGHPIHAVKSPNAVYLAIFLRSLLSTCVTFTLLSTYQLSLDSCISVPLFSSPLPTSLPLLYHLSICWRCVYTYGRQANLLSFLKNGPLGYLSPSHIVPEVHRSSYMGTRDLQKAPGICLSLIFNNGTKTMFHFIMLSYICCGDWLLVLILATRSTLLTAASSGFIFIQHS